MTTGSTSKIWTNREDVGRGPTRIAVAPKVVQAARNRFPNVATLGGGSGLRSMAPRSALKVPKQRRQVQTVAGAQGTSVGRRLSVRAPFDLARMDRQLLLLTWALTTWALTPNLARPGSIMCDA